MWASPLRHDLVQDPRAAGGKLLVTQSRFNRRLLDGSMVRPWQYFRCVATKGCTLQQVVQFLSLAEDRRLPGIGSLVGLVFPLEQMNQQDGQSAEDFALVAACHVKEKLPEVFVIQFIEAAFAGERRHGLEPGGFIVEIKSRQVGEGAIQHGGDPMLGQSVDEMIASVFAKSLQINLNGQDRREYDARRESSA